MSLLQTGCSKKGVNINARNSPLKSNSSCSSFTVLPDDETDIDEYIIVSDEGNSASNEVWLFLDGGPAGDLSNCNPLKDFPNSGEKILVQVHQVLSYNNGLYDCEFSIEQLSRESDIDVEILDRVVRHFKGQNKQVFVFSHSYGGFVTARYLWKKGPAGADKYIITGARLNIQENVWRGLLKAEHWHFPTAPYDTPVKSDEQPGTEPNTNKRHQEVELMLAGSMLKERYANHLHQTDLSKVIYVVGENDDQVGRLTTAEETFLTSKGATVVRLNANHSIIRPEHVGTICEEYAANPSTDCVAPAIGCGD
ncbi:MAG: hypothetical protein OXB84_02980 [Halobacteriovoraceae bacterium]|nr:hypothetical protein [Halobacteriovoraceae bacterium]